MTVRDLASEATPRLALVAVELRLRGTPLFAPLDLAIPAGAVQTIMGPSGCGKSSLLAFAIGILDPVFEARGRVLVEGSDMTLRPPERRGIGILFQDDLLFPHLSVGGNLMFGLVRGAGSRTDRRRRIEAALQEAELAGYADRDPATLSGGQRARISLLRTLLGQPKVLLLDEPFSKLDAGTKQSFRRFVFAHAAKAGCATLLVTHDPADADAAGGPVIQIGRALDG